MDKARIIDAADIQIEDHTAEQVTVEFVTVHKLDEQIKHSGPGLSPVHQEAVNSISAMYTEMSVKYGFEVKFDIVNLTQTFRDITDPRSMKIFEIYLSETFSRFRLVFIQKSIIAITVLLDRVTNSILLNDPGMSIETLYGQMVQLISLMQQVNTMWQEIKVEDGDTILKAMDDVQSDTSKVSSDPETLKVMDKLKQLILK